MDARPRLECSSPTSTLDTLSNVRAVPQVTAPPHNFDLRRRQQSALATCGFLDGAPDSAVTCPSGYTCGGISTFIGCCSIGNCDNVVTSCYDLLAASTCDQACQLNPRNLLCPTTMQYCAEYQYEGGSIGLGCATVPGYTRTVIWSQTTVDSNPGPTTSTNSPQNSTTASAAHNDSSGMSTGATAGIAVGATLAVVFLALLAWWFIRRRRKRSKHQAETSTLPSMAHPDQRSRPLSELQGYSKPLMSEEYSSQPQISPGLPQYSPAGYAVEMPNNQRPVSYPPTELSSTRY